MTESEMREKVTRLLEENMVKGYSKTTGHHFHYTKPSPSSYPFQFFWDTCFHAFIFTALDQTDMAKKHLESLFVLQKDDGFIGHMIYWNSIFPKRITDLFQSKPTLKLKLLKTHMSALLQPPLVAQAVQRVYLESGDEVFLKKMLPKLKKYYNWIANNRDFESRGLISIISPFESGIDWKPTFDVVVGFPEKKADWRLFLKIIGVDFRNFLNNYNNKRIFEKAYFIVKEVGFNTIYAQNLLTMSQLCEQLKDSDALIYKSRYEQTVKSMLEVMYDADTFAFYDVYGKNNKKIKVLTPTVFFPTVIKDIPTEISKKVLQAHFFNNKEFDVPYPIPSVSTNHPAFSSDESLYIWRGPTWILYNWFMHRYLIENGWEEEAHKLIESIEKLIEISGFREYYNPYTGEGHGAKDFTWSGLVLDMIQMEKNNSHGKRK